MIFTQLSPILIVPSSFMVIRALPAPHSWFGKHACCRQAGEPGRSGLEHQSSASYHPCEKQDSRCDQYKTTGAALFFLDDTR
jgi:hypothetical protein